MIRHLREGLSNISPFFLVIIKTIFFVLERFFKEAGFVITVCDIEGNILDMNDKSANTFLASGGYELIGKSLMNCHPEPARTKLQDMLATPRTNAYTIEKNGVKKLIYQTPWFENGEFKGLIELSMEIPMEMAHYVRKPAK